MKRGHIAILFLFIIFSGTDALFGFGEKDKEKEKKKSAVELGLETMRETFADPQAMKETLDLLKDPGTMEEVRKLMQDKQFIKDMERLQKDPKYKQAMEKANSFAKDPLNSANLLHDLKDGAKDIQGMMNDDAEKKSDVEIGLSGLAAAAQDPRILKDAMDSLKDPETAAEVKRMMQDPQFRAEMERLKKSPQFQQAMEGARGKMEGLASDPVQLENLKRQAAQFA